MGGGGSANKIGGVKKKDLGLKTSGSRSVDGFGTAGKDGIQGLPKKEKAAKVSPAQRAKNEAKEGKFVVARANGNFISSHKTKQEAAEAALKTKGAGQLINAGGLTAHSIGTLKRREREGRLKFDE